MKIQNDRHDAAGANLVGSTSFTDNGYPNSVISIR